MPQGRTVIELTCRDIIDTHYRV